MDLLPLWDDQEAIAKRLSAIFPRAGLVREIHFALPGRPRVRVPSGERLPREDVELPRAILLLSDLGALSGCDVEYWRRYGTELRAMGHELRALVPCSLDRVDEEVAELWNAHPWELHRRDSSSAPNSEHSAQNLTRAVLALAAFATRLEPQLLRPLRLLVRGAGIEDELEAWAAASEGSWRTNAIGFSAERIAELREIARTLPSDWVRQADEWIRAIRNDPRYSVGDPIVEHEEAVHLAAVFPELVGSRRLEAAIEHLLTRLRQIDSNAAPALARAVESYVMRFRERTTALPRAADGSMPLAEIFETRELEPAPEGNSLESAQRIASVAQSRGWIVLGSASPSGETALPSSPLLATVHLDRSGLVAAPIASMSEPREVKDALDYGVSFAPGNPLKPFALRSRADGRWDVGVIHRPFWASAMGRDRFGLWAEIWIPVERAVPIKYRLRWIPPGRFTMGTSLADQERFAAWYRDDPETALWHPRQETPHELVITRGFWLGATPVTQAVYTAIMGKNPSQFQSPKRPVERVSHDDAREFLRAFENRFSEADDGLHWDLPTEAQWEYACRAGTESDTYAGPLDVRGASHAPVLDSIAWYGGNSGERFELAKGEDSSGWPEKQYDHKQAGTHPVARKAPNAFGLYDMLGNVWEWCSDWLGPYPAEKQIDPVGPLNGVDRVIRGGSWIDRARYCRSAQRLGNYPSNRWGFDGFRLLRGPTLPQAEREPSVADREARSAARQESEGRRGAARREGRAGPPPRRPERGDG